MWGRGPAQHKNNYKKKQSNACRFLFSYSSISVLLRQPLSIKRAIYMQERYTPSIFVWILGRVSIVNEIHAFIAYRARIFKELLCNKHLT